MNKKSAKRVTITIVSFAAVLLIMGSPACAYTVDFTNMFSPYTAGSQGTSISFNNLTITAKTGMGNVNLYPNPWDGGYDANGNPRPGWAGVAGDVYWGDLGMLGALNSSNTTTTWNPTHTISTTKVVTKENIPALSTSPYTGLGVLKTTDMVVDNTTGPITYQESLVFDFALPQDPQNALFWGQMQSSTDLSFTMIGVNGGYLKTTTVTTKTNTITGVVTTDTVITQTAADPLADNVRVFLKLAGGEVLPFDINYAAVLADGVEWNSWIRWALNQFNYPDERIVGLAIEQTYGANSSRQFGVGSISYYVPEPTTMLLLGLGLVGLAGVRRKFEK